MNVAAFGNNPEQTGAFKVSDNDITDFVAGLSEKESFVDHWSSALAGDQTRHKARANKYLSFIVFHHLERGFQLGIILNREY